MVKYFLNVFEFLYQFGNGIQIFTRQTRHNLAGNREIQLISSAFVRIVVFVNQLFCNTIMTSKKGGKAKHLSVDINELLNESQFLKDSTNNKKNQKRQRNDVTEEESIAKLIGQYQTNSKKKKLEVNVEACKESRQKILGVMSHQLETRKEKSDTLLENLSEVMLQLEADCNAMKDNEKKLEHLTAAVVKCMQQTTTAHKQKLKALKDIHASYKKQCEQMETDHKTETDKLAEELEDDIKTLQQKLISETKKSGWENLRRTIFHAMQNDF